MGKKAQGKKEKRDRTLYRCSMVHKRTYKFSQLWSYKRHMRMHHGITDIDSKKQTASDKGFQSFK